MKRRDIITCILWTFSGYLNRGKHKLNFIYAYWYKGAETLNYTLARERVNEVGVFVARFINLLVQRENVELSDIHMIGHSLGAHVAGIGRSTLIPYKCIV